jgi:hypothetical protein
MSLFFGFGNSPVKGELNSSGFTMNGGINMGKNEILNLPDPSTENSAVSKEWVITEINSRNLLSKSGGTMTGEIDMGGSEIKSLADPTTDLSAVPKKWVDTERTKSAATKLGSNGFTMGGDISMGYHEIKQLADPKDDNSAVSRWVRTFGGNFANINGFSMTGDINMGDNEIKRLAEPTADTSAVSKKWVTDHVVGSSINSSGFTMSCNIDMDGHHITGLPNGGSGDSSALSRKTIGDWGKQFVKRDGRTLASDLDANGFEITRVANPTTDKSAVSKKSTTDRFMVKTGGLVEGDIDMGDSSDIVNVRDPTKAKDAVNKQWVEGKFLSSKGQVSTGGNIDLKGGSVLNLKTSPPDGKAEINRDYVDTRYVRKIHHKSSSWVWGYRGVSIGAAKYYAYCHDQIPPSRRTDTIEVNCNINLESITVKSDAPLFSDITDVLIELILWTSIPVVKNGEFTGTYAKTETVLGTIDMSNLPHTYFNGTHLSDGGSTACYVFKGNSGFYLGTQVDALNALAWCIVVKPEHTMPTGKSMDMSFCWSLNYAGSNGG